MAGESEPAGEEGTVTSLLCTRETPESETARSCQPNAHTAGPCPSERGSVLTAGGEQPWVIKCVLKQIGLKPKPEQLLFLLGLNHAVTATEQSAEVTSASLQQVSLVWELENAPARGQAASGGH